MAQPRANPATPVRIHMHMHMHIHLPAPQQLSTAYILPAIPPSPSATVRLQNERARHAAPPG